VKDKNPIIISINGEKALNKIKYACMKKAVNKLGIQRMHFSTIKAT
jgi:hypothetical protein